MVKKGVNMEGVKTLNKKSILNYLKTHGTNSRKTIAKNLNLTTAALSILTNELILEGLIVELGQVSEGKVGRKQIILDISPNAKSSLGLEISKGRITFTILDLKSNVISKKKWYIEESLKEEKLDEILVFIKKTIKDHKYPVLGLGILISGYIYENTHWNIDIPDLKNYVETHLNIPVIIKNNMRGLVASELYDDTETRSFWLLKYGPGVGSSIVMEGNIVSGVNRRAGEIGHIILSGGENKCGICNQNGCLESEVSFEKIASRMGYRLADKRVDEIDFSFIQRITKPENEFVIYEALNKLAEAVAIGYRILDTGSIILAGDIFEKKHYYEYFIEKLTERNRMLSEKNISSMKGYQHKRAKAPGILILNEFFHGNLLSFGI
ncbi:MAG: ROK family protein [Fusobacteriaceae bacterium]